MTRKPTVEVLGEGTNGVRPSLAEQIKADANRIEYETDAVGRRIGVKKLTFLDMHELTLLLGPHAANAAALQQAMMVGSVVDIDGDPVTRPVTELQLKAIMQRLDFHGVIAATTAMSRFAPIGTTDTDTAIKN